MKKSILVTLIILILSTTSTFGQDIFDRKNIDKGIIGVQYDHIDSKPIKVMIEKAGNRYTYSMNSKKEEFTLQMGNGDYEVSLLENVQGNKYRVLHQDTINLNIEDERQAFLGSVQMIKWNSSTKAVQKAQELVKGLKSDEEKIEKIYQYIVNNVRYDYEKAKNLPLGYLPEVDRVFMDNTGICYDYASLFAAMARSVGIPTKLVTGYADNVEEYHAWNEVYMASKNQWVIIDTTVDAQYIAANKTVNMIKDSEKYTIKNEY